MKKKIVLAGLMLGLWGPLQAQSPTPDREMSLEECIEYALQHNEDIAKAAYDEEIGRNQIKEVKSQGLPQINATGKLEYYPSLPTQILPGAMFGQAGDIPVQFGKDFNASAGVQLTQLLFNKSFFVGLQAAKSSQDLYRLRTEMTQEQLAYNISTAYLQILQTREQFTTLDANLERLAQLEKILQLQYENDLVKKVDVNRLQVNRVNLENQRQNLVTAVEQQKNYLKFFMGMPLELEIELTDFQSQSDQLLLESMQNGFSAEQKIEYRLLNKQKELSGFQIRNLKSGYYPSLAAFANYSYLTQRNDLFDSTIPWFNTTVVGLQLNIPIFDGFQKRSKIRQSELEVKKIEEDITKLRKNTEVEIRNANSQLENSLRAIAAQEKNVNLAQEVFETSNQLYKEGISPLTDLLDAEVALREAKTNLNNEKLKYQLAQLNYLKATGEIGKLIN